MPVANLHVLNGHPRENLKQWIRETSQGLADVSEYQALTGHQMVDVA